jgi:hypothetical protein
MLYLLLLLGHHGHFLLGLLEKILVALFHVHDDSRRTAFFGAYFVLLLYPGPKKKNKN